MTIQEAIGILKPLTNDIEALKKAYKAYMMKNHPDKNPEKETEATELTKLGNLAFELLLKTLGTWKVEEFKEETGDQYFAIDEELEEILIKLRGFVGLEKEIRGVYLWCYGNTYSYKDYLKTLGFKFAPKKKEWFYAPNGRKPWRKHGEWGTERIRETFGSRKVDDHAFVLA